VASVPIEIVRYTDDHVPGFVECRLTDVFGRVWSFEEKVPVVSAEYLSADSGYPRASSIDCKILRREADVVRIGIDPVSEYFECDMPAAVVEE
jgi:hypothetical protein